MDVFGGRSALGSTNLALSYQVSDTWSVFAGASLSHDPRPQVGGVVGVAFALSLVRDAEQAP